MTESAEADADGDCSVKLSADDYSDEVVACDDRANDGELISS